jgi:hypothetical protein
MTVPVAPVSTLGFNLTDQCLKTITGYLVDNFYNKLGAFSGARLLLTVGCSASCIGGHSKPSLLDLEPLPKLHYSP